ncbi:MAG: baseplate J/gp47 family protein, partial [bacterium]|nr:baseplate J/gp47 family protein [bacterium]
MAFGITDAGFILKTQDDILQELTDLAVLPEYFGPTQDLTIYDPVGQFLNIMAKALSDSWEGLEDAYYSFFIDTAEGVSLDRVVALGGMTRIGAQKATVTITASGVNGTTVLVSDVLGQTSQAVQFENISSGVVASGTVDLTFRAVVAGEAGIV